MLSKLFENDKNYLLSSSPKISFSKFSSKTTYVKTYFRSIIIIVEYFHKRTLKAGGFQLFILVLPR